MKSRRWLIAFFALLCVLGLFISHARAQSPSVLYTWDNTGNPEPDIESWVKNFGTNTVTLDNLIPGELRIIETGTPGEDIAMSDGANRVRESSTAASGGTDVLGLDFMEFDIGHSGTGPINVQFFVQASTGFNFVALGPDVAVAPGVSTYQVPLTSLTGDQAVYLRTIGFNARDHLAEGNVTWTLREVRAGGTPLANRVLASFNNGTAEGGLNGALVNFDGASVFGNTGQNQTGFSQNPSGSGSLQWIDLAGGAGGAISIGNGTALNGNTFNNRTTDLSNYVQMHVRMSATETSTAAGGTVNVQPFFQGNNFTEFQALTAQALTIDGQFHDLFFTIPGTFTNMNVLEQTGLNLGTHTNELQINVDIIEFSMVPEPASMAMVGMALAGCLGFARRGRRTS